MTGRKLQRRNKRECNHGVPDRPDVETVNADTEKPDRGHAPSPGGSNLSHVRAHNERLVLSLIRTEALSRAEISPQNRPVGANHQPDYPLLARRGTHFHGEPIRGKIGQPSVPLQLNADGAYFLGLKVGRRSAEMILINFMGDILQHRLEDYAYPIPQEYRGVHCQDDSRHDAITW